MRDAPSLSSFTGFPREGFAFLRNLARHNNRDWFTSNNDVFERSCRDPLKAMAVALDPPLGAGRITRIHRDLRFSKDKSPYHTHISTVVRGYVLWLSAEGLYVGTGLYMPEPAVLRRLREAIDQEKSGKRLAGVIASLRRKRYAVGSHESLASAPRGFATDHPRVELLRMKDIHAGRTLAPAELSSVKAVDRVRRACNDVSPLREWLDRHVGKASCQ